MGYRRYRRRRSSASHIMADTAHIANRASWYWSAILGVVLFAIFYWAIPAWINSSVSAMHDGIYKQFFIAAIAKRAHWSQWFGIALGLVCAFFAIRNFFLYEPVGHSGERNIGFFSRLLARFLD